MKIPVWILTVVSASYFGLQAWTLSAIVDLKVEVGKLEQKIEYSKNQNYEIVKK